MQVPRSCHLDLKKNSAADVKLSRILWFLVMLLERKTAPSIRKADFSGRIFRYSEKLHCTASNTMEGFA